jgi:hypothetical protein
MKLKHSFCRRSALRASEIILVAAAGACHFRDLPLLIVHLLLATVLAADWATDDG